MSDPHAVGSEAALAALYEAPHPRFLAKVTDRLEATARAFIAASPFCILATAGPQGPHATPRGDAPGFAVPLEDRLLALPDRRGNNRLDALRDVIANPEVALLFLIPGVGETFRVNGRASISVDPELMQSFAVNGKLPRSVLLVHVETAFFHCSKAIVRSKLWDETTKIDRKSLPSTGTIIAELSGGTLGGEAYDRDAPARIEKMLY